MPYHYQTERPKLFTEDGMRIVMEVRDKAISLLSTAGAFKSSKAMASGDGWTSLAALDYLVERGEIRRVTGPNTAGQDQVFVKG